ncbi:WYL domain-containing protein, partial [Myxococcota bacterium]|nr:WYL domain-containing protein [Myxococcota bacterium]
MSQGRPAKKYSQALRLIKLYDMLKDGADLRASELSSDFGVHSRTIERDIAILKTALDTRMDYRDEGGRGRVHFLPRDKKFKDIVPWQILAIGVGTKLTGFLSGQSFVTEVRPLLDELRFSLFKGERSRLQKLEKKIHVIEAGQKDYRRKPEAQKKLRQLIDGLQMERPVSLRYLSYAQEKKLQAPRLLLVHPLSLVIHRGGVYFVVDVIDGDWTADDRRILLALDRMGDVRYREDLKPFDYPKDFSPDKYFAGAFGIYAGGSKEHIHVKLRISPTYA